MRWKPRHEVRVSVAREEDGWYTFLNVDELDWPRRHAPSMALLSEPDIEGYTVGLWS